MFRYDICKTKDEPCGTLGELKLIAACFGKQCFKCQVWNTTLSKQSGLNVFCCKKTTESLKFWNFNEVCFSQFSESSQFKKKCFETEK